LDDIYGDEVVYWDDEQNRPTATPTLALDTTPDVEAKPQIKVSNENCPPSCDQELESVVLDEISNVYDYSPQFDQAVTAIVSASVEVMLTESKVARSTTGIDIARVGVHEENIGNVAIHLGDEIEEENPRMMKIGVLVEDKESQRVNARVPESNGHATQQTTSHSGEPSSHSMRVGQQTEALDASRPPLIPPKGPPSLESLPEVQTADNEMPADDKQTESANSPDSPMLRPDIKTFVSLGDNINIEMASISFTNSPRAFEAPKASSLASPQPSMVEDVPVVREPLAPKTCPQPTSKASTIPVPPLLVSSCPEGERAVNATILPVSSSKVPRNPSKNTGTSSKDASKTLSSEALKLPKPDSAKNSKAKAKRNMNINSSLLPEKRPEDTSSTTKRTTSGQKDDQPCNSNVAISEPKMESSPNKERANPVPREHSYAKVQGSPPTGVCVQPSKFAKGGEKETSEYLPANAPTKVTDDHSSNAVDSVSERESTMVAKLPSPSRHFIPSAYSFAKTGFAKPVVQFTKDAPLASGFVPDFDAPMECAFFFRHVVDSALSDDFIDTFREDNNVDDSMEVEVDYSMEVDEDAGRHDCVSHALLHLSGR
jgi:hypothetical protein